MSDNIPPWERVGQAKAKGKQKAGMLVDLRRCTGCHACSVACKTEHHVPLGSFRARVRYLQKPQEPTLHFLPMMCMQCADAPCLKACSCGGLSQRADGVIVSTGQKCTGKGACISACPYGAIFAHPDTQVAEKCDLCTHRTDIGLAPACVDVCPTEALRYGDWADPNDPMSQEAKKHPTHVMQAKEGTKPSVRYIGLVPWMDKAAKSVQLSPDENELIYEQGKKK